MADTYTTNLSLRKPQVGVLDETKDWAEKLNDNFDLVDTAVGTEHNADGTHKTGKIDHGGLLGLTDDDHTQYLLVAGTRAMTGALQVKSYTTATLPSTGSGGQIVYNSTTDEMLRWSTAANNWVSM